MATARTPPWKRPKPKGAGHHTLTRKQIAAARARAKEAGRRYPNLVDNMWAAKQPK
jgi:ribosomal protein L15E